MSAPTPTLRRFPPFSPGNRRMGLLVVPLGFMASSVLFLVSWITTDELAQIIIVAISAVPATIAAVATFTNRRHIRRRLDTLERQGDRIEEQGERRRIIVTREDGRVEIFNEELESDDTPE